MSFINVMKDVPQKY